MIKQTILFVNKGKGVMLVSKDIKHQKRLYELLSCHMNQDDIYLLDSSIFMTDESVKNGTTHDYKVVIVPQKKSEGYTLTRLKCMITSVYPSSNATREQLEGRINRLSQHAKKIYYRTIHTGILTYIMQKHKDASSISAILSAFAQTVTLDNVYDWI